MAGLASVLGSRTYRRPSWEIVVSLLGHVVLFGALLAAEAFTPEPEPLIKPENITWIAAAPPPKGPLTKASRTPDPVATKAPPSPDASKAEVPPPPPTASDMVLHKEDAPKTGDDKAKAKSQTSPEKSREELLREQRRSQAVKDQSAALGTEDRIATSPDGVEGDYKMVGTPGGLNDPEILKYIEQCRKAIIPNWTPLPSTIAAHPNYVVGVVVIIEADGRLRDPKVYKSSGDRAFDQSGILAIHKTGRFPPPPAKYAPAMARGVLINLKASDK